MNIKIIIKKIKKVGKEGDNIRKKQIK